MARRTSRRSASVLPTAYCSIPAPMAKPSRMMNITSMNDRMAYQISTMGGSRLTSRPMKYFAADHEEVEHSEHKIETHKADERE